MNPVAPSTWTKSNSEILAQFFESGTGAKFLDQLAHSRPGLVADSNDIATVALRAQYVAGYERALNAAILLAVPPVSEAPVDELYPDLDRPITPEEEKKQSTP